MFIFLNIWMTGKNSMKQCKTVKNTVISPNFLHSFSIVLGELPEL